MSVPAHRFASLAVHAGQDADPTTGAVIPPVHFSTTYAQDGIGGLRGGYEYGRSGNPTRTALQAQLAAIEGGAHAFSFASGLAAEDTLLRAVLSPGDAVLLGSDVYGGTHRLLARVLGPWGVTLRVVDMSDPDAVRAAVEAAPPRILWVETPSNPLLRITDITGLAQIGHEAGALVVVDNTFATPYLLRPLEHGADVVVHSASKFLAGHGNVLGGAIVDGGTFDAHRSGALFPHLTVPGRGGAPSIAERAGGDARIAYARESVASRLGPTPSPLNAFLIGQGMETLSLRVDRQSRGALAVAQWLQTRPEVASVDYAGLASHPDHDLAARLLPDGYGSVFTFTLHGDAETARRVVETLETFTHMTHLGDVRSLILHPATTSHVALTPAERAALGVADGTLRVSIGIEDVVDLIDDLEQAFVAAGAARATPARDVAAVGA